MRLLFKIHIATTLIVAINFSCQPTKGKNEKTVSEQPTKPQSVRETADSDSLIISDINATLDPFAFGEKPLSFLTSNIHSKPTIKTEEFFGEGDMEKVKAGYSYTLNYGMDYFQIYKRVDGHEYLFQADISTTNYQTRQGIKIGMTKSEILEILNRQDIKSIPNFLLIGDLEYSYFFIEFDGEKVSKIIFDGYLD